MKLIRSLVFLLCMVFWACGNSPGNGAVDERLVECGQSSENAFLEGEGALLASRFESLEELNSVIGIEYSRMKSNPKVPTRVKLTHCSRGQGITSILDAGISQADIMKVQKGGFFDRLGLVFQSPYSIRNRGDLEMVYVLARRKPIWFGEGDVAFYDLAENMTFNINTADIAIRTVRDTSEKGYLNSFNHLTAQAFITTIFSEGVADFVADLHERKAMPELITGKFTQKQLVDSINNPVDNYVDIVNNEWGQELGKQLKVKYRIDRTTYWTPELLAAYLNDLQSYYGWAFQIGFRPFRPSDKVVSRFSAKINLVMANKYKKS